MDGWRAWFESTELCTDPPPYPSIHICDSYFHDWVGWACSSSWDSYFYTAFDMREGTNPDYEQVGVRGLDIIGLLIRGSDWGRLGALSVYKQNETKSSTQFKTTTRSPYYTPNPEPSPNNHSSLAL